MLFGSHIGFVLMRINTWIDFHLIFFLDNQNLGIDIKIGFLSGTVPNYWIFDISAIMLIHDN